MAAKLVAEEGSLKGLVLSLEEGDQWVIGRDPDACQLLVEDPLASRKHLICRTTPQGIQVENLSTTNPVQVNDEEVKEPRLLQNGDTVRIGSGIFRYYAEAAAQLFKEGDDTSESEHEEVPNPQSPNGEKQQAEILAPAPENKEQSPMEVGQLAQEQEEIEPSASQLAPPPLETAQQEEETRHDTIFEEEPTDKTPLAQINFGLLETGRWLLKVIGGPNNGAEFSMQTGSSYVIGTDPNACDIVFHDTSVSRQHARITVGQEDVLTIEDLKSRNGTVVDGEPIKSKLTLVPNTLVSVGTTSFVVFDREGEMQTIISPLMPSIVKVLQSEEPKKAEGLAALSAATTNPAEAQELPKPEEAPHHHTTLGAFILIGILTGLFVIVGIGTSTLFRSEPIVKVETVNPIQTLNDDLAPFPSVKYTFNKNTGQLLLVGHVLTSSDRSQLLYALHGLKFIKNLDDSGIVIDEYVWREIDQILETTPDWKGITIMSSTPGHFVVSGYLKTRAQADRLSEYLSANFPYPDLLEKRIVVDEDVLGSINNILLTKGLKNVVTKLDNGEVVLTGGVPAAKAQDFDQALAQMKDIRGVRNIRNLTIAQAPEQAIINISDKYEVTGISSQAGNLSVVINGRILMKGDVLDGMTITKIQPNTVFLEKGPTTYRIDFNQ